MAKKIFDMPVHPDAALFPMLDEDDLDQLAEDIKANGLRQPIVIQDGLLVDGRNRLEACRRADVEPVTVELNGDDPKAYILSLNINRRHMNASSRAMVVAMMYPDKGEHGRGRKDPATKLLETGSFKRERLRLARLVLQWAPELAKAVLGGAQSLDEAVSTARDRQRAQETQCSSCRTFGHRTRTWPTASSRRNSNSPRP